MTLFYSVPFDRGILVSADRASEHGPGRPAAPMHKLRRAGGALYTASGICEIGTSGAVVWSVHDVLAATAPPLLTEADLPELARAVSASLELWATAPSPYPDEHFGVCCTFWQPRRFWGFTARVGYQPTPFAFTIDPHRPVPSTLSGGVETSSVIQGGKLTPASYATLRRRVCDVSEGEAVALALDVQRAVAAARSDVGGGVDIEVVKLDLAPAAAGAA